jgi:hypothetical protein
VKLQKDLKEFIALLNSHGVEFVVMGGHAVAFHGYPRVTADLDFFVRANSDNARRIATALGEFGFSGADESLFSKPQKVVMLGRPPNRIDILTKIDGVDFDQVWHSRIEGKLDGIPVSFPSRDMLLQNKRASGRAKDLADVAEIEKLTKA